MGTGAVLAAPRGMSTYAPRLPSRRRLLPVLSVALPLLAACGSGGSDPEFTVARSQKLRVAAPAVSEADRAALSTGNATFALALHGQVRGEPGNLVHSPYSVTSALAMTWAGARGETESEMARALSFTLPQARLHPAMNAVDLALATRGEGKKGADGKPFRLHVVNAVWAQRDFTFLPAYLDTLAESYDAGVNLLDFVGASEAARVTINDWVAGKTEQRIKDLLRPGIIGPSTRLVLTNAVYFNAAWKVPFEASATADRDFQRAQGGPVKTPFMNDDARRLRAASGPGWKAVALPYDDDRLSMLLLLPDAGTFDAYERALTPATLDGVVGALGEKTVRIALPKWKFEAALDLKQALVALGMERAFSAAADFSGMNGTGGLAIQDVVHKAFIAVAEKGTEAAAATAVVVREVSAPLVELELVADRPFLFFVRDEPTGTVLFAGRVVDPSR
jgi:serpin B